MLLMAYAFVEAMPRLGFAPWVLLKSYLCILASFPRVSAPPPVGCEGRLQGKKMWMEELKKSFFLYIGILDHSSDTSQLHQQRSKNLPLCIIKQDCLLKYVRCVVYKNCKGKV